MRRLGLVTLVALVLGVAMSGSAAADPSNSRASCEGILVSSASYPGEVADLGRALHQQFKDLGLPPGLLDVGAAQVKAGSVENCLATLPG
jgi:hypothetical protein